MTQAIVKVESLKKTLREIIEVENKFGVKIETCKIDIETAQKRKYTKHAKQPQAKAKRRYHYRKWTPQEKRDLVTLANQGKTRKELAKIFKATPTQVTCQLHDIRTNGIRMGK